MNKLEQISREIIYILDNLILPDNPAIVFDIDHTLIDGYQRCLQPIVNIFNHAKNKGITPFIITYRAHLRPVITQTQNTLKNCNINGAKAIYFRPLHIINPYKYKEQARLHVKEYFNHNVIMSIGDSPWDIGKHGGIGILI